MMYNLIRDWIFSCFIFFRAEMVYEDMKQRYGLQGCYLLKINSRASSPEEEEQIPDPWSQYLHKQNLRNQVSSLLLNLLMLLFQT